MEWHPNPIILLVISTGWLRHCGYVSSYLTLALGIRKEVRDLVRGYKT
jgi:hypothetical protein